MSGVCGCPVLVAIPNTGQRVCLLLRSHIPHHQTSKQGRWWSRRSWSEYCHGDHVTWSERRTGWAADDWSGIWRQVDSHGADCSEDDDHRDRRVRDILVCPRFHRYFPGNSWWGKSGYRNTDLYCFFTARCMECTRGLATWKLSVRLSVCLSVKRVDCNKTEEISAQIFNTIWNII